VLAKGSNRSSHDDDDRAKVAGSMRHQGSPMTPGSALSAVRELAESIPAATGPLSAVPTTFTWKETVSW
jgi:hypothetical protein